MQDYPLISRNIDQSEISEEGDCMRRVRGGRNKDAGLLVDMALITKDNWLSYLLVFLCALAGILIGVIIGKIAPLIIILLAVVFLGLLIAGLITAWAINRKNQLLEMFTLQEGFKEQYNALYLLINELEDNLGADSGAYVRSNVWQDLKYKYAYFPTHIYEDLSHIYKCLVDLRNLDIVEYRRIIIEELNLPDLIAQLKDLQLKIRRQLPYIY